MFIAKAPKPICKHVSWDQKYMKKIPLLPSNSQLPKFLMGLDHMERERQKS